MNEKTKSNWGHACLLPNPGDYAAGSWFTCPGCPERWLRSRTFFRRAPMWQRCDWAW